MAIFPFLGRAVLGPEISGDDFFITSMCCIAVLLFSAKLMTRKPISLYYNNLDIISGIFLGYCLIRTDYSGYFEDYLYLLCLFILYFIVKQQFSINRNILFGRLPLSCFLLLSTIELCSGYAQLTQSSFTTLKNLQLTGQFENSTLYSLYLLGNICLLVLLRGRYGALFGRTVVYLVYIEIFVSFYYLILAGSRTAWIAAYAAALVGVYRLLSTAIPAGTTRRLRLAFLAMIVLCVPFFIFLINYKLDSALGRILIWKSTILMITDRPLLGHGLGSFFSLYSDYQGKYFAAHPGSEYAQLASNPNFAFNEYLQIAAEIGITGLAVVIVGLCVLVAGLSKAGNIRFQTISTFAVLALCLICLTAYPLRYGAFHIPLLLLFGYLSARVDNRAVNISRRVPLAFALGLSMAAAITLAYQVGKARSYYSWKDSMASYRVGRSDAALDKAAEAYAGLSENGKFLYYYGSLNMDSRPAYALAIFKRANRHMSDSDLYVNIGDCYRKLDNPKLAEVFYMKAAIITPVRFLPVYKIFELYRTSHRRADACSIARKILEKPIKIQSSTVNFIKDDVREWLAANDKK
jgi:O-antigen polymerase